MFSNDINGCRETNDLNSSGRRFISTSLSSSSSSEDESSFSIASSEISSCDEDVDDIEATLSLPVQKNQSESSGFSSGSGIRTVSVYSSMSSYVIQYVELSSSDQDSSCSFQDADISNSSHDTDEVSSRDMKSNSDPTSENSSYLIDQASTSAEDALIVTGTKHEVQNLYVPLQDNSKSSSSDRESSLECSIKHHKYTYKSNICRYYKHSSESDEEIKEDKKSIITVENISKISEEFTREDITHGWVMRQCYDMYSGLTLSDSSESYKTAESDLEELGFRDTFRFASSNKPKEFAESSKEKLCNGADKDDIVPERQCKVTFAPPEKLVRVRHFERTTEEVEDDIVFQAMVADAVRFRIRIELFKSDFKTIIEHCKEVPHFTQKVVETICIHTLLQRNRGAFHLDSERDPSK